MRPHSEATHSDATEADEYNVEIHNDVDDEMPLYARYNSIEDLIAATELERAHLRTLPSAYLFFAHSVP